MKLHDITAEVLREAVRLYLEEAYKEAEVPAAVKSRLQWPDGADLASIAAGEAFETSPGDAPLEWCERVRLRLGNEGYPFMKFGLDHVPDPRSEDTQIPDEILQLAKDRDQARADKDYAKSDSLRDQITTLGFEVKDTPQGSVVTKK
jgi:cysteinyl-tRNA synthetase